MTTAPGAKVSNIAVVKDKVQRILVDDMELDVRLISEGYQVRFESTAVNIRVFEQGEGDSARVLIKMWAPVVRNVGESPELFRWIATEGTSYLFGNACWNPDPNRPGFGMVSFDYALLGDYLDGPELRGALAAVAVTADELDDELQQKFGGQRFIDADS